MKNFKNEESTKRNLVTKQRFAFLLSLATLLTISFCASYFITDYLFITLKTKDEVDIIDTLSNIITKYNLKEKLTEEELSNELSKNGYNLSEKNEQKLTFTREKEVNSTNLSPNKYYLGEENGYISVFKTDSKGEIIEPEKKVYSDSKPISNLPETDQNYIKENKFSFDSKDEALQKLSEMIS